MPFLTLRLRIPILFIFSTAFTILNKYLVWCLSSISLCCIYVFAFTILTTFIWYLIITAIPTLKAVATNIYIFPRNTQESSPAPQFESISSLELSLVYSPTFTSIHDYWKNHSFVPGWMLHKSSSVTCPYKCQMSHQTVTHETYT